MRALCATINPSRQTRPKPYRLSAQFPSAMTPESGGETASGYRCEEDDARPCRIDQRFHTWMALLMQRLQKEEQGRRNSRATRHLGAFWFLHITDPKLKIIFISWFPVHSSSHSPISLLVQKILANPLMQVKAVHMAKESNSIIVASMGASNTEL